MGATYSSGPLPTGGTMARSAQLVSYQGTALSAPPNSRGTFLAAQFSAGYTTNMSGFDLRQAQLVPQRAAVVDRPQALTACCKLDNSGWECACGAAIPAQAYPRTSRRRGVGVTDDRRHATEGVQQNVQHHVQQENELANL